MIKKYRRLMKFKHKNKIDNMNKKYWLKEDDVSDDDLMQLDSEWGGLTDAIDVIIKEEQKKQDIIDGVAQSGGGGGGGEKKPPAES